MPLRNFVLVFFHVSMVSALCAQPGNDICSSAIDLQPYLLAAQTAPAVAGPFSNVSATGNDLDIASVTGCWLDDLTGLADGSSPQIDATVWFRLQGIGQDVRIAVQPCDTTLNFISEDSQLALFSGECDSLELVDCNEDIDPSTFNYWSAVFTPLSAGTEYRLAVDGFNYSGFGSPDAPLTTGEFCIHITIPALLIDQPQANSVVLFPNPTEDRVLISAAEQITELRVFNLQGQLIDSIHPKNSSTVNVQMPQEAGVYIVAVQTGNQLTTHRLIRK